MANIFDTAKYILEKTGEMSTMKLQKLCYYAQAWSLVWDDTPLFTEDFQAWANGPVCPELFYKTQGQFSVTADDEDGKIDNLTAEQKDSIDKVLKIVPSKYQLVYIVAKRSHQMKETKHYQLDEKKYVCSKNIGRALEEVAENLIHVKE